MDFPAALDAALSGRELSPERVEAALAAILDERWEPAQVAAFLVAMRCKGETPSELAAAARSLRTRCVPVAVEQPEQLVDTCGTGGDARRTFNISTAAAFAAAAAGARVAKHGNRAQSGICGSSDLVAALGADLDAGPERIAACLAQTGICFMFAPAHHPALRAVGPVRASLGVRTMFNLLGPLLNPAAAGRQVAGIFSPDLLEQYAATLRELGCRRALVVNGEGLDEFSICGPSAYAELREDGTIEMGEIEPGDAGLPVASLDRIQVSDRDEAVAMFEDAIAGGRSAAGDASALNAGAALYVGGHAASIAAGCRQAAAAFASGAVRAKADEFKAFFAG